MRSSTEVIRPVKDLSLLLPRFIAAQDVNESSKATYSKQLKEFFHWLKQNRINKPIRQDLLNYKHFLQDKQLSPLTISNYIVVIRKLFAWTESLGLYQNIGREIRGIKRTKGFRKDCLTVEQVRQLLNVIDRRTITGMRDYCIINTMVHTAIRTIEVVRANIDDLRQVHGETVLYIQGKGHESKDSFVILTKPVLKPLRKYLSCRGKLESNDPLFAGHGNKNNNGRLSTNSLSKLGKYYLRSAGINSPRVTLHSLRHTSITLALIAGASLQQVRELARHMSVDTTLTYSHNLERFDDPPERRISKLLKQH